MEFRGKQRRHGAAGDGTDIPKMPSNGYILPVKIAELGHFGLTRELLFRRAAVVAHPAAFAFGRQGFFDGASRQHAVDAQEVMPAAVPGRTLANRLLGG